MPAPDQFRPCNEAKAFFLFFFSPRRYIDAAVQHAGWLNLQEPGKHQKLIDGSYDPNNEKTRQREEQRFRALRWKLWTSLATAVGVMTAAVLLAASFGFLDATITISQSLSLLSVLLVAWAALFTRGGVPFQSWSRNTLSEKLHPAIYLPIYASAVVGHVLAVLAWAP